MTARSSRSARLVNAESAESAVLRALRRTLFPGRNTSYNAPFRHGENCIVMPPALMPLLRRARSLTPSIGQLTYGSFLLLLVLIALTSMASVIAIRHIGTTFAELQRLQDVGDLAEEIDRQMNELRLAARDLVADPAAQSDLVARASSELNVLLKRTRLKLAPEQQTMIDGVSQRLANYREGIERVSALISRRAEELAAVPPVRVRLEQ